MKATIENSRIANNGKVALDANNGADIRSLIASVAVAVAGGGSGAIGAALGVALARNLIGFEHNGCSSVTYSSNSPRNIVIHTNDTILIGSGPGAGDVYQYLGTSSLSDPTPNDQNSPNWLAHLDFNDSDLWRRVDLQSNPAGINAGLLNSSIVSAGALSADAASTANIRATVISASAAITGGGDVGVSAAGAGTGVLNHISMDVLSYINGDSNVVNAAATQPSYRGPDGVIIYTGNDAEIAAVMPNSFATSFAGTGLPTIHVQSVDLTATDSSSISSVAGAVSLAAAVSGLVGGSIAVGASVAENRVDNTVHAFILNANDGIFTTGSSDVTTTPTTQTIDGQSVTLNNYTISFERDGNVALTASESANIASVSFAAALAASASLLAASLAGAGATALNVINNHVSTDVHDSNVSTFGELAQAADGTVVGVTTANLLLNSTNTSIIDSEVIAVSAAISGSIVAGAGSIGVALAENRIGDSNAASGSNTHGTYATVSGSKVSTTGDTQLLATSSEQLRTVSAAGSIAVAIGVGAAGSATGTSSLAKISGDTHASIVNSTVVAGGDVTVDATSTAKVIEATAIGASVAIATGALSVAVTLVENTIDYDVKAWVSGTSSQHVSSLGDIRIEADATEASIKNVQGVTASLSAGLHTASAGGMSLINTIDNRVAASILGPISVDAGGNLSVKSNEASEIEADAAGVTVAISLGAAVGVATIENTISSQISTTITDASLSGGDIDLLATSQAELTKTRTVGVAASLVGVTTNLAKAELKTKVASTVSSATIAASEDLTVQAKSNNYARVAADGGAIGAFAAGVMVAQIDQGGLVDGNNNPTPEVRAELGDHSKITASGVILEASSTDDLLASSISATGGIVAINGADSRVTSDQSTLARIGASTNIVANAININSFANQNADSSADSLTIAAATGAGAATTNRVLGDTNIIIDDNAQLRSNVFTANAANSISKTGDVGSNNIRSGSIAAGALFVVTSDTDIGTSGNNATSTIDIQPDVKIEVGGNNTALGVMQLQATMRADAVDSVRLETASGYSLTTATSDLSSTTRANIDISGATLINRSGDIGIATQSDIGLRPSSNLFSAALNAAAGSAASAVSNIDNTITIDNSTVRGAEVRIQSGRDNFQVPNLMSNFADIEVTTVSLGPSISVGVPKSEIDFTNFIDINNGTSIEGYKDVLLISERNEEIPARADTDGLVLSLSGLPYGYPVSSAGEKVTRNAKVDVSANSNVTAGLYNQSVMLIRSVPIDNLDPNRLTLSDPSLAGSDQDPGLFQASDYAFADSLGFELDPQVPYHYAPLKVDQISLDITIDTIVHVVSGYSGGGVPGHYYKFRPLDARGNLRTDLETVPVVLQSQNYADTSNWLDIGTSLPPGYNPNGDDLPVYESNYTANFEQALNNKFYLIKNPDLPSPSLSYRNVGNMLIAQREQILSWMASHSNNQEAVARYQEQLNQVDQTLTELGLVTLEDMGNGQSKMIITEDLDAMFIQLPGVYAAPGSVFVEGYNSDVHLSGEVKAREGSSITIHNASPFVPIVTDAIVRDNRRVAVVDQELRQFTPGNVFVNWQVQGTPVTGDGFGTGTITITHSPSNGNFDVAGIPANTLKDLYIEGSVVNENGTVNIANPIGTINVTGEVRGSSVTINAGKNFNLNTDDWLHTNRDPRQYINYFPLRQSVFNQAGTTKDREFATATAVNIPTYRTVRFWGFTITIPVPGNSTLQDSINQSNSQIVAQGAISVTARYLNVNGLIQSGVQTITVGVSPSFNPGRSTSTLTDAQNRPLAGISFGDPSDNIVDVPVSGYFDAANRSIVIHDVQPSGGRVTLVGELLSTGNGSIVAAYGHASLNIDNKSKYKLVMNEIDLTHDRVGEIILVDSNLQTRTTFTYAASGITKKHEKVNPSQPLLTGPRGEVSGLNYVEVGKKENATGTDLYYHPGADEQITAAPYSGNLYYVWVEGQEKTKVEVRKYEKRSFNLFGDNAFGDLLVRDGSFKWETVNFRDAVPVLESEVVYSPTMLSDGSPNSSDPLDYIVGNAYTIKYNQTPDRDVTLVPGQTIVHLKAGFPSDRGVAGKYYRIKSDVTTRLEVVLPDENYNDTTRWERFDSNPGSLQNTVESDYENYKQTVKRWTTGGGWLRKKTMHTEITTISGVTDYYTHSLRADYPIQIGFVGSSAATSSVQINSVTDIVLQGDVDVPLGSSVQVNSTGGDVIGASTVGFYGATPSLTVAGDVNINVETGLQPLTVHAGGKVYVDGITNATSNGGSGDGPTGNVITVQQIDAGGDVFINAADGIIAQDANSFVRGDHVELRTLRGDIGTSALPIKIDSQYSGAGGLSAFAEGSIYVVETSGSLQLISPASYSSQATGETDHEGIAVRSLTGSVQLTTINGDIVDGIKETYAAPTQAQIDALNDRMALFGAKALEAAQATIRGEENLQTEAYHGYWLNQRNAVRQSSAASTLAIAAINFTTNTITTSGAHGLQSGAELHATSGQIGLTNGFTYFAVVVDATHIRIAPTRFDAAIAATNDPANPNSGRIVDLVAGADFNASQLSSVHLDRFNYTADPDNVVGSIAGIPDAWRVGPYNPDFVYEMPQAEQDAIIEARVRQATEVANPISATLRRFLYPESYIFSSATTGQSTELRNILAAEIRLNVTDTNAAVNPPTGRVGSLAGIQTLPMEFGINGVNGHASLLSEAQKQLLASAIVDDVIGHHYVNYRYVGNSATPAVSVAYNFQDPSHDFTNASLWERVEPDFITTTQQAPFQIQTGETVLVEYNKTSYGWYRFVGTTQTVTLETQNFADTSLWQPLVADHETADTQLLDGEPLNTVKTVNLFFGNLVSDTTTVDRLTIQVVDDVNIQLIDEGSLITLADGDIAIQADGDLRLSDVQTPGNVRLSSSGNMYDLGFGNAAVAALGTVNLEGQVVQSITVGEPLRVLVGPSGSLSGASSGNFNVVQGHGTFAIDGQSNSFGNLVVPRAFAGGTLSLDVTGGNLTIGKLESSTGFELSASGSILDGDATSVQEEWNLYGPIASITSGGTIGVGGNAIDLRLSGNLDASAPGSVFLKSELPLSLNNLSSGGANVQIDVTGNLSVGRLVANDATTQLTATGGILDGREVTTDHLPDGLSNITTRTLEIVAGTGSANTATIGTLSNPLEINTSVNAVGSLTATADAGIFVAETTGDLNITQVSSLTGVATLFSAGSIVESGSDAAADVLGSDILLYAGHGTSSGSIGSTGNPLEIDTNTTTTLPASRLTAIAAGGIDLLEVSGSLNVDDVHSTAAGNIVITLPDTASAGQNLLVDATARLLNDNGAVKLLVGDNATFQYGATLGASTEFNLIADHNDADVGTGVSVELLSNVASPVIYLDTGDDEDSIHLVNLAANRYYVDGHGATDNYSILLDGSTNERVSITDSGAGDDGADVLTVDGTSTSDLFLLRKYFLALLQPAVEPPEQDQLASTYERIDYDETINGRLLVRGGAGDDRFVTDDNSVITTLDGGGGADQFQIGQVFGVDPNSSVATGDEITTQQITHGYLSRGVSMPMVVYGGNGADQFTVFSNKAAIRLEGEDGNDTFLIRAFIIEGNTDVEGGEGDDYVEYNINAPVSINGGSGFDRVVAVGTEADDSFVLTDSGVFGAGLSVTVDGVEESVEVDGLEGNDSFYVLSTRAGVTYNIIGGLGSDTAILAGDVTQRIVASQTTGSSAVINHGSSSTTDVDYDGALMPGVGVTVAGSQTNVGSVLGAVVITESNGSTEVTEDVVSGIGAFDEYTIGMALDRNQFAGAIAYLTISAAAASTANIDSQNRVGQSLEISIDGGTTYLPAAVLVFDASSDATWSVARTVRVRAISDLAQEGQRFSQINHSMISNDNRLVGIALPDVQATIFDNDLGGLIVRPTDGSTVVVEGTIGSADPAENGGVTDSYTVQLTSQPTSDVTVTLTHDSQITLSSSTLTFTSLNWNQPQSVVVTAVNDSVAENRLTSSITMSMASADTAFDASSGAVDQVLKVDTVDDDSPGALIVESGGGTLVSAGDSNGVGAITDSYTLRLTKRPTGNVEIPLITDGQTIVSGAQVQPADSTHLHPYVVFDASTWNIPVTIDVAADPSFAPTGQPTLTFAYSSHNTAAMQGTIIFTGGQGGTSRDIATAIMLPEEDPQPPVGQTDSTNELQQTDTLLVFNDASVSDDTLVVTPTNLSGINMGTTDTLIPGENGDPDTIVPAGINYFDIEVVQVMMGIGNDTINVNGTAPGAMTVIHGGGNHTLVGGAMGGDTFNVTVGGVDGDLDVENNQDAPLILLGDTFQDGTLYSGTPGIGTGNAIAFDHFGNDTFNITSAMGVTVYGGSGDDSISGGSGDDLLLGGSGDDSISGNDGHDRILGDSGLNANLSTRIDRANQILTIVTSLDANNTAVNRDLLVAGDDDLSGGAGNDLIFGDHGSITLGVIRPASTGVANDPNDDIKASTTQLLLTSRAIVEARSEATSNGGSDKINGGSGDDRILAGFGADFVNFDRNGQVLLLESGDDVIVGDNASLIFSHTGNLASTDGFGWLMTAQSISASNGDDDLMTAGVGRKIIIGGKGNDSLLAGDDSLPDTIFGDNAIARWDELTGIITSLESSETQVGGDDIITAGDARNILIGGSGADSITGGDSVDGDIILGDNGQATFVAGILTTVESTSTTVGAADEILAANGPDIVIGGIGNDSIDAGTDSSRDIVLGDNGIAHFLPDGRITDIASTDNGNGGDDDILVGNGDDIVFGGFGADAIGVDRTTLLAVGTDSGNDIVLGDNGSATFYTGGAGSILTLITTTAPTLGGDDLINASAGQDIVLGGAGADSIDAGSAATNDTHRDIVLGDNGEATFNQQGLLTLIQTLNPSIGGNDTITTGGGDDIVLGGASNDSINLGSGLDVAFGDNGRLDYLVRDNVAGSLDQIITTDPTLGGTDTIFGGSDNDILIGGTGADTLSGDEGFDIVLGDHAEVDYSRPVDQQVISRFIAANQGGGDDIINGGANDDFLFGGQGADTIHGGIGQDDIVGGHNVAFGADGNDEIYGDEGEDVILGDNGIIGRTLLSSQLGTWQNYLAPFSSVVIRQAQPYDDLDLISADDTIYGGDGMDILRGQRGDDEIHGGNQDDEIIGGLGSDTVTGDAGQDFILGDAGQILRDFNDDGTPRLNSDGTWHRDILTEEIGRISAIIATDPTSLQNPTSDLANQLLAADRIVMAGVSLSSGARKLSPISGQWQTVAILIDLVNADDDNIDGSDGNDVILGQRGDDTLGGGDGNDLVVGDHGINTASMETDLSQMLDGIRLIGFDANAVLPSNLEVQLPAFGHVIVPEFVSEPGKIVAEAPRWDRVSEVNETLANVAASDQLSTADNLKLTPSIAFTPHFVGHTKDLFGNDTVSGDAGNDLVIGDNLIVNSKVTPGVIGIQSAMTVASAAITGVTYALEGLMLDRDLVRFELDNQAVTDQVMTIASDTISGGDGNDVVVGDNGTIELPLTRTLPGSASIQTNAANLQQHLANMRTLAEDAMHLTNFAHLPWIDRLLQDAAAHRPSRPAISASGATYLQHHRLIIGEDQISGNNGDDTIIGGDSILISPLVTGGKSDLPSSTSVVGLSVSDLHDLEVQLSASAQTHELQIEARRTARTFQIAQELAVRTPLNRIAYVPSLDRDVDNDVISGGDGADVISGDFTALVTPLVLTSPTTTLELENLDAHVKTLIDQLANRDRLKTATEFTLYAGRQSLAASSTDAMTPEARHGVIDGRWQVNEDEITGEAGSDLLFGDNIAIVSTLMIDNLSSYTTLRQSNYNVAYLDDATSLFYGSTVFKGVQILSNGDLVDGGDGDDTVMGMRGGDVLEGRNGNDTLLGGNGTDTIRGGTGVNEIRADGGDYPRLDLQEQLGAFRFANTTPVSRQLLIDAAEGAGAGWQIDPGAGLPPGLGNGNPDSPPPVQTRTVQITSSSSAVTGQPVSFSAAVTDLPNGALAQFQWEVRNAQNVVVALGSGSTFKFTPSSAGSYSIKATAMDDQNGSGSTTVSLSTTSTSLTTDPNNAGKSILVIGGTSNNDNIRLNRVVGQPNSVEIRIDSGSGWATQVYTNISRIDVYGGEGDDDVTTDIQLNIPLRLYGGNGDDKLRGGKADDYLSGDAGNDRLIDNDGYNVLVGGLGADRLNGGSGQDLLIGDRLSESVLAQALMQVWSDRSASFNQRVSTLANQLAAAITADGTADDLAGYQDKDWYFAQLTDRVRIVPADSDRVDVV